MHENKNISTPFRKDECDHPFYNVEVLCETVLEAFVTEYIVFPGH